MGHDVEHGGVLKMKLVVPILCVAAFLAACGAAEDVTGLEESSPASAADTAPVEDATTSAVPVNEGSSGAFSVGAASADSPGETQESELVVTPTEVVAFDESFVRSTLGWASPRRATVGEAEQFLGGESLSASSLGSPEIVVFPDQPEPTEVVSIWNGQAILYDVASPPGAPELAARLFRQTTTAACAACTRAVDVDLGGNKGRLLETKSTVRVIWLDGGVYRYLRMPGGAANTALQVATQLAE